MTQQQIQIEQIEPVSTDGTLSSNSDELIPTEKAVKTYVDSTGGSPTGSAGGDLAGTYPNPEVAQASKSFDFLGNITYSGVGGTVNDWNPTGLENATVIDVAPVNNIDITGIAGGSRGRVLILRATGGNGITLHHEDIGSSAANRFVMPQEKDIWITQKSSVSLMYSETLSRWMMTDLYLNEAWDILYSPEELTIDSSAIIPSVNGDTLTLQRTTFANFKTALNCISSGGAAGGDLAGTYPNPDVVKAGKSFILSGIIIATPVGTQNDWNPAGLADASFIWMTPSGTVFLNGLQGGSEGRVITLSNGSAVGSGGLISVTPEAGGSAAGNRFDLGLSASLDINPGDSLTLRYSGTISRWRILSRGISQFRETDIYLSDNTLQNVSVNKHGFAPKAPDDGTKFLDGTGAYDTVKDSDLSTSDITTNNVGTSKHGFAPKAPNDATKFLDGTGAWSTPASGSGSTDGWTSAGEAWTYASASTFTVSGNQTTKYTPGTRLKFTQTTVRYATVLSSAYAAPNTTVTIFVTPDYVISNAAISANYYSYQVSPQGYPDWFNWTAGYTGFSVDPAGVTMLFRVEGSTVFAHVITGTGTSNATTFTITGFPVASIDGVNMPWGVAADGGATLTGGGRVAVTSGTTTFVIRSNFANGAWTNSGNKSVQFSLFFRY